MRSKSAARLPGTLLLVTCPEVAVQNEVLTPTNPAAQSPSWQKPWKTPGGQTPAMCCWQNGASSPAKNGALRLF